MARNMLTEYVIRLGADVDNSGLQMLFQLLDSAKVRALGVSAALGLATVGVYKFVESVVKQEEELIQLDKKQKENIKTINAQNKALSAMGKTLKEVQKDDKLNKVYKDIVKFNKELELPNADGAIRKIEALQASFWKLRSGVKYVVQSIGRQVMINLEAPIQRITGGLNSISEWIKTNFNSITMKVSSVLTSFAKGIIGIGETIGKIFEWINAMPSAIKGIAMAIGVVFGLLNSGPLGKIMALISLIGDTIHDAENYQWNQQNAKDPKFFAANNEKGWTRNKNDKNVVKDANGNAVAYQIDTAYSGIWDIAFGEGEPREKATKVATKIFDDINNGIKDAINAMNSGESSGLREWISTLSGPFGEILGGIVDWVSGDGKQQIAQFASDLITAIASVLAKAGELGVDLESSIAKLIYSVFGGTDWEKVWNDSKINEFLQPDNAFAVGLTTALETALAGGNLITSLISGGLAGYQQTRNEELRELYSQLSDEEKNQLFEKYGAPGDEGITYKWLEKALGSDPSLSKAITDDLQEDFNTTVDAVLEALIGGVKIADDVAGNILSTIVLAIANGLGNDKEHIGGTISSALSSLGEDNMLWDGMALGLATWIGSGSFLLGLFASLGDIIANASSSPDGQQKLKEAARGFSEMLTTLWEGALVDDGKGGKVRNGIGLKTFLKELIGGDDSGLKKLFDDLAADITLWLDPVKKAIVSFFNQLWIDIYNNAPDWIRGAISKIGVADPNRSNVKDNGDGTYTIESTTGESMTTRKMSKEEGEWLMRNQNNFALKDGKLVGTGTVGNSQWWYGPGNAALTPYGFNNYLDDLLVGRESTVDLFGSKRPTLTILNGILKQKKSDVPVEANTEPFEKEIAEAIQKAEGETVNIPVHAEGEEGENGGGQAFGGRFGKRTRVDVAEDGAEYIIPITKPERAASLIKQMFAEMGSSAVSKVVSSLGLGEVGTNGASFASLNSAMNGMTMANTYNINAPVNINVNSTGADAKDIGSEVYNLAERHLIKNVMGVFG